jgi:hypothetical protein
MPPPDQAPSSGVSLAREEETITVSDDRGHAWEQDVAAPDPPAQGSDVIRDRHAPKVPCALPAKGWAPGTLPASAESLDEPRPTT